MMRLNKQWLMIIFVLFFAVSLVSAEEDNAVEEKKAESIIGIVKKLEETGKYIYINLDEDGKDVWLATMPSFFKGKLIEGDKVEYIGGDHIKGFQSKALNRTFDSILFVTRICSLKDKDLEEEQPVPQESHQKKIPVMEKEITVPVKGEIIKVSEGKNIEELFMEKDELNNKEVIFKGKVMKISKNILAKTWITLQDGTGSSPNNKIIAVTQDTAQKGDIIVVKGILKADVNLGSGYRYKVLIDEARIMEIGKASTHEKH